MLLHFIVIYIDLIDRSYFTKHIQNNYDQKVGSSSPVSPVEGALPNTTGTGFGIQRVVSASSDAFEDDDGQIYTVPMNNKEKFDQNLLNNVAAEDVVMDDIIGHMATPMGDQDEDDDTPTVEMQQIGDVRTAGGEHDNVVPPNDQDIDDINNNMNYHANMNDNDDDLINDIDEMGVTAGNDDDIDYDEDITEGTDDDDVVNDIDDIVTPQDPAEEGGISMIQPKMTLGGDDDILDEKVNHAVH